MWRSIFQATSNRFLSSIPVGPRHGDPFHRYLGGIPVWRTASRPVQARQRTDALTGLRHGDLAYRCLRGILAWRTASRPVHDRQLTDALVGLRHVLLANECLSAIPAERDGHQSHGLPAPARDIHRASSPCPQASQRQIALRSEGNLTSPSKRICPTPTWNGVRLARCFA